MSKVALITGGARGIGLAVAELLTSRFWKVALLDLEAEAAADSASRLDGATAHAVDVADSASVDAAVAAAAAAHGRVDALVAAAGHIAPGPSESLPDAQWGHLVDVHLTGGFRCARAVHPHLAATRGSIVFVSSVAGRSGIPGRAAYSASKAGLEGLARTLSIEWAPSVRVNTVAPGYTLTPLVEQAIANGVVKKAPLELRIPLGRLADPAEIAAAIVFLAVDGSYVTGQTLVVDGGMTIDGRQR